MVRIIKPRTLGILTRTLRHGRGATLIVSAYGLFDVGAPGLFLSDQALWPAVLKELPEGATFDSGMMKPQGEMLVAGRAMTPKGEPAQAMMIEISVGAIVKRVSVFGDRYWEAGVASYAPTAPQPFVEMKIDPRRMFGGPGHALNSFGVGHDAMRMINAGQLVALPNFEAVDRPILTIDDAPESPGLGPIDPMSKARQKYAGTYDALWQEKLAPGLPLDVDPRLFCAAPEDQRITGFFAGEEPMRVVGMTADPPGYSGALPGLRARAFVQRTSEPAGLVELEMKLDTVLVLGSLAKGVAVFRGALPVADIDAKDAAGIMIAYERMGEAQRPFDHYLEVYRLRTDKEQAIKYVFAESQLTPTVSLEELQRRRKARENQTRAQAERFAEASHLITRRQFAEAGLPASMVPAKPAPVALPVLLPTREEIESGDLDLAELLDGLDKASAEAREKLDSLAAAVQAGEPGAAPNLDKVFAALDGLLGGSVAGDAQTSVAQAQAGLPSLDGLLADLEGAPEADKDRLAAGFSQAKAALAGELISAPAVGDEEALTEAKARFLDLPEASPMARMRQAIDDMESRAASLEAPAGASEKRPATALLAAFDQPATPAIGDATATLDRRLREAFPALAAKPEPALETLLADLSALPPVENSLQTLPATLNEARAQVDRAEADLRDGMRKLRRMAVGPGFPQNPLAAAAAGRFGAFVLEQRQSGLDLRGRDLAGVDLAGADLSGVDLSGAFFERADLSRANFAGANCRRAVFAGANLEGANFDDADLNGANLSQASARSASFRRADMREISAMEAVFAKADLSAAQFARSSFIKTDFTAARLAGATFNKVTFVQCPLDDAVLDEAVVERCQMIDFSACNLRARGSKLIRSQFLKLVAPNADFCQATLDGSGFASGAKLPASRFDGASLLGTTLQGADLTGARFVRARLDGAILGEAKLADANFICASLKRAQLGAADLARSNFFAANLFEAQLRRAALTGANLRSANLYSADLSDVEITGADLTQANCAKTRLALETSHAT